MNKIHGPEISAQLTYFFGQLPPGYEISLKYRIKRISNMNKIHGPEVAPKLTDFFGLLRREYEITLKRRTILGIFGF